MHIRFKCFLRVNSQVYIASLVLLCLGFIPEFLGYTGCCFHFIFDHLYVALGIDLRLFRYLQLRLLLSARLNQVIIRVDP